MNLLVTGAWRCTEAQLNAVRNAGHEVVFLQQEKDSLPCAGAWVEGAICNGLFLYHSLEQFPNLRFLQLTSAGFDRIPMDEVKARNIRVCNAKGVYSIPAAEHAVGGVLQIYRQSRFFYENRKLHKWEKRRDLRELNGKTVLIIGCGDAGTECAKRFRAFGCRVTGVNRSGTDRETGVNRSGTDKSGACSGIAGSAGEPYEELVPLDELDRALPSADVVVLTIALAAQTAHLLDARRFAEMKSAAVLVNISRGAVVEQAALRNWLENNPDAGAVLDVFEEEPLRPDSPLWNLENVIITPHNGYAGDQIAERLFRTVIKNLSEQP